MRALLILMLALWVATIAWATRGEAQTVMAQQPCDSTEDIETGLGERWGEYPIAHGVTGSGQMMQVWVNPQTGTFSVLHVTGRGRSCFVSTGDGFDMLAPPVPGDDM
jgi:hypothetical protein